jgi:hypothetical protein
VVSERKVNDYHYSRRDRSWIEAGRAVRTDSSGSLARRRKAITLGGT